MKRKQLVSVRRSARLALSTERQPLGEAKGRRAAKLKQQIQLSSSSSSSSSGLPLRKNRENMDKGKSLSGDSETAIHRWSSYENQAALVAAKELAPKHTGWNDSYYQAIADEVNRQCRDRKKNYVDLNFEKVAKKFKDNRSRYNKGLLLDNPILCELATLKPAFMSGVSGEALTSSSILKPTVKDRGIHAALQELLECGELEDSEMYKYAAILGHKNLRDVFWAHGDPGENKEQKFEYIKEILNYKPPSYAPPYRVQHEPQKTAERSKMIALKSIIDYRVSKEQFTSEDLSDSSYILEDKVVRDVFHALPTYQRRADFLKSHCIKYLCKGAIQAPGTSSSGHMSQKSDDVQHNSGTADE